MNILSYFLIGLIIGGVGTLLGALISLLIRKPKDKTISFLLNFAAGIMLSVIALDLMPEAYEIGGFFIVTLGLFVGLILIFVAEKIIPVKLPEKFSKKNLRYIKMSIAIIISMSLHNFPEGVAVGSSFVYSQNLGSKIGILIAAHDIPEGLSVSIPLVMAGVSPLKIVFITILTAIPTAIGSVVGGLLGEISSYFIAFCLSSAASAMLYVASSELIPEAHMLYSGKLSSLSLLLGFILGSLLSHAM